MIKYEVDALILEGSEAGGHIGPVSLTVLLQEVLLAPLQLLKIPLGLINQNLFLKHFYQYLLSLLFL